MPSHENHHRRHARAAWPDAKAIASALAEPFPGPNPFADPEAEPEAEANPKAAQTLVSVVYITAKPTFDGPIGGYKTLGVGEEDEDDKETTTTKRSKTTAAASTVESNIVADTTQALATSTQAKQTTFDTSASLPTVISSPKSSLATTGSVVVATDRLSGTPTSFRSSATADASESTSSASASEGGMTAGGKAGMAIGVLCLVGALLALILFFFKKRKQAEKEKIFNEKSPSFGAVGRADSTRTTANAPRLSLRPVTQFLPNLGGEKRQSRGNALLTVGTAAQAPRNNMAPIQEQESNRNNPFGNHAETIDSVNARGPTPVQVTSPNGQVTAAAVGAGAGAVAGAGLVRGASKRVNGAAPMDYTTNNNAVRGPPSPANTEFSQSSVTTGTAAPTGTGAAIAAAGGPANSAVHRVQLDFKPSMEDELELRAGQLIRLLHEYDDGWVSLNISLQLRMLIRSGSLHSSR